MIVFIGLILISVLVYYACISYANRRVHPRVGPIVLPSDAINLPNAGDTLKVMTWNIGYGALGKNADLIIDSGTALRANSAKEITRSAQGISRRLAAQSADVICLQENANAGFLTRNVPVRAIVEAAMTDRLNLFWADMESKLVPRSLRIEHGMSVHTTLKSHECTSILFPQDDTYFYVGLKKHYGAMINRFSITNSDKEWVVFNIHLSAFDPDVHSRLSQLEDLLHKARIEFEKGHYVVIAGDWNMRIALTDFAHQTDMKDVFLLMAFPHTILTDGWKIAVDPGTPTVRSLNAKYVAGSNYTAIIDGFVCSPNVELKDIATTDLGFQDSDHHPVEACFKAL